jgi:hypothetical protein
MADDPEPTQKTPKGHEIPIPERDAVLRDLMKVAPPVRQEDDDDDRKKTS